MLSRRLAVALCIAGVQVTAYAQATFAWLRPDFNPGRYVTDVFAPRVSADGSSIAWSWTSRGFIGDDRRPVVLLENSSGRTEIHNGLYQVAGIDSNGRTVALNPLSVNGNPSALRWRIGTGLQPLGGYGSSAHGINEDGSVIVGSAQFTEGSLAFRWNAADSTSGLSPLPGIPAARGDSSTATDVDASGNVVVGVRWGQPGRSFIWKAETGPVDLGQLFPWSSAVIASAVSGDGRSVFGNDTCRPFVWRQETGMVALPLISEYHCSEPLDANYNGTVIVGRMGFSSSSRAVFWTGASGMVLLQDYLIDGGATGLDGWRLTEATSVSADGTVVVGLGVAPDGGIQPWKATLPCSVIRGQPANQLVSADSSVSFIVTMETLPDCSTPFTFQWQRRNPSIADPNAADAWVDLQDSSQYMHTQTAGLVIADPIPALATGFRCRIGGGCKCGPQGTYVYTETVNFSISCPADFNSDGGVDFTDLEAFFERWENGC